MKPKEIVDKRWGTSAATYRNGLIEAIELFQDYFKGYPFKTLGDYLNHGAAWEEKVEKFIGKNDDHQT